jgi:hypothetical protein
MSGSSLHSQPDLHSSAILHNYPACHCESAAADEAISILLYLLGLLGRYRSSQ